jgi:hypothetical protein
MASSVFRAAAERAPAPVAWRQRGPSGAPPRCAAAHILVCRAGCASSRKGGTRVDGVESERVEHLGHERLCFRVVPGDDEIASDRRAA